MVRTSQHGGPKTSPDLAPSASACPDPAGGHDRLRRPPNVRATKGSSGVARPGGLTRPESPQRDAPGPSGDASDGHRHSSSVRAEPWRRRRGSRVFAAVRLAAVRGPRAAFRAAGPPVDGVRAEKCRAAERQGAGGAAGRPIQPVHPTPGQRVDHRRAGTGDRVLPQRGQLPGESAAADHHSQPCSITQYTRPDNVPSARVAAKTGLVRAADLDAEGEDDPDHIWLLPPDRDH